MNFALHFPFFTRLIKLVRKYFPLRFWIFLALYILLNNGLYWIINTAVHSDRYDIILEYIWILPLLLLRKKWSLILFSLAYISIYIFDLLWFIKQFYHYDNFVEFIELLKFIPSAPKLYWLFIAGFTFYLVLSLYLILKFINRFTSVKMIIPLALLYLIFSVFYYDYRGVDYSSRYMTTGWWGSYYEYVHNLKVNLEGIFWNGSLNPDFYDWPDSGVLQKQINMEKPPKKLLFILNESWGIFTPDNGSINSSVYAALANLTNVKLVAQGENPALESTIEGEIRELCDLKAKSGNFAFGPFDKFKQCVSVRLQEQGYQVQSFHASDSKMYNRKIWYPHIGFQNAHFFPHFSNIKQCHSFHGACDYNVVHDVSAANKAAKGKSFIYWLTLNTHHPYSELDMLDKNTYDCKQPLFKGRQEACRNLNLQNQFFQILANEIKDGGFKDTEIIVVGDHPPPLILDEYKDSFKSYTVPFIHVRVD